MSYDTNQQKYFFQSIQQTFPKLDRKLQEKIYQKVSVHMIESLKEQAYQNDPHEKQALSHLAAQEYTEHIFQKLMSLP